MFKIDKVIEAFEFITRSTYNNIPGVALFDSGKEGPTVGISIVTHGNEPIGLYALKWFLEGELQRRLQRGRVFFVANNMAAAHKYIETKKRNGSDDEVEETRFVDVDMNRLPDDLHSSRNDAYIEVQRARCLLPVWKRFDYALDLHSTTRPSSPMIVAIGEPHPHLIRGIDAEIIITNILQVQKKFCRNFFLWGCSQCSQNGN